MLSNEVVEGLKLLGLNEYETKVYVSLLDLYYSIDKNKDRLYENNTIKNIGHADINAYRISEISGVPRTKVYQTLFSLEKKGWVSCMGGKPKIFLPVLPELVIEAKSREIKRGLEGLTDKINTIYKGNEGVATIIANNEHFNKAASQIVASSQKFIVIASPQFTDDLIKSIDRELLSKMNKGIETIICLSSEVLLTRETLLSRLGKYNDTLFFFNGTTTLIFNEDEALVIPMNASFAVHHQDPQLCSLLYHGLKTRMRRI